MSLYNDASLVMIPSAYKDGKLYSIKPTDGSGDFTFSRGSNLAATRVDVNGLIEKGRENLLLQSNDFSQTDWAGASTTETGGQSGYDGSNDAWLLTKIVANGNIAQTVSASNLMTFSVYAKASANDWLRLNIVGVANAYFDLDNGVVGSTSGAAVITSDIIDVGNGWYRCSFTYNVASTTGVSIYVADSDGSSSGTSGSIYIQDAQLELGLVATDYIETTTTTAQAGILEDMPRLDYSGSCPSLLLEPTRTNLLPHSEYFDTAYSLTNVGFDYNNSISPEGLQNAAKVIPTNGATIARVWRGSYGSGSQVASVFAKAGEYDSIYLAVYSGSVYKYAAYNLSNGSLISATADNYGIESYGNGWYRVWVYLASSTARYVNLSIGNSTDTISSVGFNISANGVDGLYIYGYQVEIDVSYPTSYIPCYGAATTRSNDQADNQSLNPVLGNGNISVMYDFVYDVVGREGSGQIFLLYSNNNSLGIKGTQSTDRRLQLFSYGDFTGTIGFNEDVPYQTRHKVVFRVTGEVVELFYNGVKQSATISGAALGGIYNWSRIKLDPTNAFLAGLNQLAVFPTALTDSECIALTTI